MSIFALPSEIFQQILSETVAFQNFTGLRLVHPHFNSTIRVSAEHLVRSLVRSQNVFDRVLSLNQQFEGSKAGTEFAEQKLSALLRLHGNVATCGRLEAVFGAHREKFIAFPIGADVPAKSFGSIESVLVFAAFQQELVRVVEVYEVGRFLRMIAQANFSNDYFQWLKLDQRFVDDLQAVMTIHFNDAGAADHWQNEQLGSTLLVERILWAGPSWLAKSLHQSVAPVLQQLTITAAAPERTIWTGSHGEAAQLTANRVARLQWKERATKLAFERQVAETLGMETTQRRSDLRVDAAVWRGSSGG